jgi:hypothetical protein
MLDPNSRIAVLIRGVSYRKGHLALGSSPRYFFVDYDKSKDNIKHTIIDPLKNCDVFLTSYQSERQQDVIDFYKPKNSSFTPYETGTQRNCLERGLAMVLEEHKRKPYETVIIIRFDVHFHRPITELNIIPDKFNFCWREIQKFWKEHRRTGDCFHAINGEYIQTFIDTLGDKYFQEGNFHKIYDVVVDFIGEENVNIIEKGYYDSNTDRMPNPIYHINRLLA